MRKKTVCLYLRLCLYHPGIHSHRCVYRSTVLSSPRAPALQVDLECYEGFRNAVHAVGTLDALLSLAAVARLPGYVRPSYRDASPREAASGGDSGVDAPGTGGGGDDAGGGDGGRGGDGNGEGDAIVLRGARHPTVERVLEGAFVPNDVDIRYPLCEY